MYKKIALILFSFMLFSCSSVNSISQAPLEEGHSLLFNEQYEFIKKATIFAVENMDVSISDRRESEDVYTILFTHGLSAFSWGEVGRVRVVAEGPDSTRVYVATEKRVTMQIAGPTTASFSTQVFGKIREYIDFQKSE